MNNARKVNMQIGNVKGSIFDLTGRTALVTGGSKGLGKAMASAFSQAGASVLITSRHEAELKKAIDEIRGDQEDKLEYLVADLHERSQAEVLADSALKKMGCIDILVNNAGTNVPQPIDEISDEDWDRVLELNVSACMVLTRALVPQMKKRGWGRIIHISSVMGLASAAGRSGYSTTKSALLGLTYGNALDLGPHNITVNCIAPGPFLTDLPRNLLSDVQKKHLADQTALGRWAEPDELGPAALLLASEAGSFISGTTLVVDGGMLARVW
jgi:gluconate 5-dehydrogenase